MSYKSVFREGLFDDCALIVTGGGSGIGRCTAHELAALGADVALIGRKIDKLEKVQAELPEGRAMIRACDIRVESEVAETVKEVLKWRPRVHGLVNNAGGQFPAPLALINQKGWETVVRTNLTGGFLMARELFVQHLADHGGSVVNIVADMWGGMPGMGHSGAARAGMVNFTETAALEWAPSGVRVNAVAPGWIASSGLDKYPEGMREQIVGLKEHVPLGRLGTESEISAAIVFLMSEAASFITGTCLRVDGAAPNLRPHFPMPPAEPNAAYNGFHLAETPKVLD